MKFDVKVVLECLKGHSEVYTVRNWESRDRYTVVEVNNVGYCIKEKICKVSDMRDLVPYVYLSGFTSAEEWWDKITKFKATEGWLYRVAVLEEEDFGHSPSIITFTGNRNIKAGSVQDALLAVHEKYPNTMWRSGMAYGLDLAVAEFAYLHKIPFEAHLPFPSYIQVSKWRGESVHLHTKLLTKAVKVFTHSPDFSLAAYQVRNVKMAEGADVVVAFNKNTNGGTVNMINHCKAKGITVIDGFSLGEVV